MRYLLNGHSLVLHEDLCMGCGMCEEVCPHGVISVTGRKAAIVNRDSCMECGACRTNCQTGAIRVSSGVGCAQAIINGMLSGNSESCNCG